MLIEQGFLPYEYVLRLMTLMKDDLRIMISGKIPITLHEAMLQAVENKLYKDKTELMMIAIQRLLLNTHPEPDNSIKDNARVIKYNDDIIRITDGVIKGNDNVIRYTQGVIKGNEYVIKDNEDVIKGNDGVMKSDDNVIRDKLEYTRLETRLEEKERWILELENHNETLKTELENANLREQDLKSMHNNYMLQMQTLINQKAIEASGAKKPWYKFW